MDGSVIQTTGLRMGVLLGGCWCHYGPVLKPRINSNTLFRRRLVLGQCSYHVDPCQTKFQPAWFRTSVILDYSCYVVSELNWPLFLGLPS